MRPAPADQPFMSLQSGAPLELNMWGINLYTGVQLLTPSFQMQLLVERRLKRSI